MSRVLETDLAMLLHELAVDQDSSPTPARFVKSRDESLEDWLSALHRARNLADHSARRHRARVDAASKRLFGETVLERLPRTDTALEYSEFDVDVPANAQLADIVPQLADVIPAGPRAPAPGSVHDKVHVRVISPPNPTAGIIRLHGGAFWMGGGDVSSIVDGPLLDHVAITANAAVFDVDYRLAPEHPYPAAVIDALSVLDAVRSGVAGFNLASFAIMGTSSGANCAVIAARADASRNPAVPLSAIALVVPSLLLSDAPSRLREDPTAWQTRLAQLQGYVGETLDTNHPWVSPAAEPRITGLAPTFMAIALNDEVAVGAERLRDALTAGGSDVDVRMYAMTHVVAPPRVEAAFIHDAAVFLRDRLAR